MQIPLSQARRLVLGCQGLDGGWRLPKGKEGVAQAVERLGYIQIDTIAVVQRAHHHTLWSRCPDYAPEMLHALQARDRRVFEYWAPAASVLPMRDYRYFLPRMRRFARGARAQAWLRRNAKVARGVMDRIAGEGPLGAAAFADTREGKRGSWWDWKPAKRALEMLFSMGELMIAERSNFQRIYDLTERVLPKGIDTSEPGPGEVRRFWVRRKLGAMGVATAHEVAWGLRDPLGASEGIAELIDAGQVAPVRIRGLDEETHYALADVLQRRPARRRGRRRVAILSPFDSLVIQRPRLKRLFDFAYNLECYLPAARRRYGYFCLPVLWGDRFIGRLDPKADRKERTLRVRAMVFEPDFNDHGAVAAPLAAALHAFAAFNGCRRVVIEKTAPAKLRAVLRRELKGASGGAA